MYGLMKEAIHAINLVVRFIKAENGLKKITPAKNLLT